MTTQFESKFSEYEEKVIDSFNRQEVMKTINASLEVCKPGYVEIKLPHQKSLTQQHGFIHGGIVSTVLDSACGYAAFSLMPEEAAVLTIEFKTNLLSPAKGDYFIGKGKVVKSGKNITFTEAELYAYTGANEKLVATMSSTVMAIYDRKGVDQ